MKNYLPFRIAGMLFLVMGMVHLARQVFKFQIIVGNYSVPLWLSMVAGVICVGLSIWMLKTLQSFQAK